MPLFLALSCLCRAPACRSTICTEHAATHGYTPLILGCDGRCALSALSERVLKENQRDTLTRSIPYRSSNNSNAEGETRDKAEDEIIEGQN